MLVVPINIGLPFECSVLTSSTTALYFDCSVLNTKSIRSSRILGLFVGIVITSIPYIFISSSDSVAAVPVIPDNLLYILKKFWSVIVA